jgi:hypothetical protein
MGPPKAPGLLRARSYAHYSPISMDIFVGGLRNPDGHGNSGRKVHPMTEAKGAAAAITGETPKTREAAGMRTISESLSLTLTPHS